jgi:hypothetical protein
MLQGRNCGHCRLREALLCASDISQHEIVGIDDDLLVQSLRSDCAVCVRER